jgi:hypothetical protein
VNKLLLALLNLFEQTLEVLLCSMNGFADYVAVVVCKLLCKCVHSISGMPSLRRSLALL